MSWSERMMRTLLVCGAASLLMSAGVTAQTPHPADAASVNTLSKQEREQGWRLLWDGHTTAGWKSAKGEAFPATGWQIRDGELSVVASNGGDL